MSDDVLRCFDPAHRSYSDDKAWDTCQERGHLTTSLGVARTFRSPKVARGSTIDDVVMAMLAGSELPDVETTLRRHLVELATPCDGDEFAKQLDAARAQLALFERDVLPDLPSVYATQFEMHWDVDGIPYHAHLDIVYTDGSFDDLKSTDQRLGEHRVDSDVQLTTYADGLWRMYGTLPPAVGLIGLVNANPPKDVLAWHPTARKPWVDRQLSVRTEAQLLAWEREAKRREASRTFARSTGIYQTQGRSSLYECTGCAVRHACPAWEGTEQEAPIVVAA
jgi:hypothetical protein